MSSRAVASSSRLLARSLAASSSRLPSRRPAFLSSPPPLPLAPAFPQPRFASTATASSSTSVLDLPPASPSPSIRVTPPDLERVKSEGFFDDDVKLVPVDQAQLVITPAAVQQLQRITSRESPETIAKGQLALRVGVESGGCHGYQYTMELTEERGVDDYVFQPEGAASIPVIVDLVSLGLVKGSTLHHATELIGSSFRIQDNPQAKDGGACGCGISWEAKE